MKEDTGLNFFDWKQKAIKLTSGKDKEWFYTMFGRYCNNVRSGKWSPNKILPVSNSKRSEK